ncbi:MAG TPA: hypothetical protein VM165_02710 [Planctomycetaceae bacterium]|nr:hypothetical protein [Planctomycetaceae bacterium]
MDLERIACGSCGANLDVPDGVQFVTCRHCGSALKVARTDSVAFTEVLQTLKEQSARIADNTDVLRLQNEIALLDQEWERRSADLMIHGKHGRISTPDKTSAVIGGVVITIFGLIWTVFAGAMFPPMAIFGLLFVGFGLWNSVSAYDKAGRYESLQAEHDRKRQDLQSRLRSLDGGR